MQLAAPVSKYPDLQTHEPLVKFLVGLQDKQLDADVAQVLQVALHFIQFELLPLSKYPDMQTHLPNCSDRKLVAAETQVVQEVELMQV